MKLAVAASAVAVCTAYSMAVANATRFDGVYIGLHGGVAIADADYVHFQPLLPQTESMSFDESAFLGGAQLGVRFDMGPNWVLGLEASFTTGNVDSTEPSPITADRSRSFEVSEQATATLQIGRAWGDWLVYVKGGYANAEIETFSNIISTGQLTSASSDRESGWTVGVGIEHMVAPNVTLGLSYDYSSYSPDDRSNVQVGAFGTTHIRDIDANVHLVTARIGWTF
jgi:outer membrane immunogenic protein